MASIEDVKGGMRQVLAWIFGALFLAVGLSALTDEPLLAAASLVIGTFLFPPIWYVVQKLSGWRMPILARGIVIVAAIVALGVIDEYGNDFGLDIQENTETSDTWQTLNRRAIELHQAGRFAEALPLYEKAMRLSRLENGEDHVSSGIIMDNFAGLHTARGDYQTAETLGLRALEIFKAATGENSPKVAVSRNNLGHIYYYQGRFVEAKKQYEAALAIREQGALAENKEMGILLDNLALVYGDLGDFAKSEAMFKRALAMLEKVVGPESVDVAKNLNNLALQYTDQGRYGEAEPLLKRALDIQKQTFGEEHPDTATGYTSLGKLYFALDRFVEAESHLKHALAIDERILSATHPAVGSDYHNLAELYRLHGRTSEALSSYERALAIFRAAYGEEHPSLAAIHNGLGLLYTRIGRLEDAEQALEKSLGLAADAFGVDHVSSAITLNGLAILYAKQARNGAALEVSRRATDILRKRAALAQHRRQGGQLAERKQFRDLYANHLNAISRITSKNALENAKLVAEGFEVAQSARATAAGEAISRMAARFVAGGDALAHLVREQQDAMDHWRKSDAELLRLSGLPPDQRIAAVEERMRRELAATDEKLVELDNRLKVTFPQYDELVSPGAFALADVQTLLSPDEALLSYLVSDDGIHLFVVRSDRASAHTIEITGGELQEAVANLRLGLDLSDVRDLGDLRDFNRHNAYDLYQKLFEPAKLLLAGVRHIFLVPDGALQSLPFGVLVTGEPKGRIADHSDYRREPWLARQYAITVLPTVSSLRALRLFAKRTRAEKPFLGIGDPSLRGKPGAARGVKLSSLFTSRGVADVRSVRNLAPLPESADELRALAATLNASEDSLQLQGAATETWLKTAPLAERKVIAFATHGLLAGELDGVAEPALVLTPPEIGTDQDDGLLTASEVAQLKLDADWVILSACNTAAGDGTPGAEGLSGLAKAFFYAGARTLLVSHWPVSSSAAVQITTRMLAEAAKPGIGRAEAHRRAMMSLLADGQPEHYAHPAFWAPFVVIGEGGIPLSQ